MSVLIGLVALIIAVANATTDTSGLPNLFPEEHNQGHGKVVMGRFAPYGEILIPHFPYPKTDMTVCRAPDFRGNSTKCKLFWCEADKRRKKTAPSVCECYRKEVTPCVGQSQVQGATRYVGLDEAAVVNNVEYLNAGAVSQTGLNIMEQGKPVPMSKMILEEWESGDIQFLPVTQTVRRFSRSQAWSSCAWSELCYCGSYACASTTGTGWTRKTVPLKPDPGRLLQMVDPSKFTVSSNKRADIALVFGIIVSDESPLLGSVPPDKAWRFSGNFQASQPWAQRNMYEICIKPPKELRIAAVNCWIKDFREWAIERGERFPVHHQQFDSLMLEFLKIGLTGMGSTKEFLWIKDGGIRGAFIQFLADFSSAGQVEAVLEYKEVWNDAIDRFNSRASRFVRGAWHTSQLWVRAEAQKELISSTVVTLLIVLLLAFLAMLMFTFDVTLSLLVVVSTLEVISMLAFFIVCVMQWAIGPIEVIALIVFIGYAVTYSLHITHKYGDKQALEWKPEKIDCYMDEKSYLRFQRTGFALTSIGGAAMGSAVTTCGCSIFLLCCKLMIFVKLGGVVLAVTVMSIFTALAPLPSSLLLCGPLNPGKKCIPCGQSTEEESLTVPHAVATAPGPSIRPLNTRPESPTNPALTVPGDRVIMGSAAVGREVMFRHPSCYEPGSSSVPFSSGNSRNSPWHDDGAMSIDDVNLELGDSPEYGSQESPRLFSLGRPRSLPKPRPRE